MSNKFRLKRREELIIESETKFEENVNSIEELIKDYYSRGLDYIILRGTYEYYVKLKSHLDISGISQVSLCWQCNGLLDTVVFFVCLFFCVSRCIV